MKNSKAISPIFATLILIAIAVIAGVVVYMFTSGYLANFAGTTGGVEDSLAVPGASLTSAIVTNTGDTEAVVTMAILKDSSGTTIDSEAVTDGSIMPGITETLTFTTLGADASGTHTITLVTAGGGSFVSAPFSVTVAVTP